MSWLSLTLDYSPFLAYAVFSYRLYFLSSSLSPIFSQAIGPLVWFIWHSCLSLTSGSLLAHLLFDAAAVCTLLCAHYAAKGVRARYAPAVIVGSRPFLTYLSP